MTSGTSEIRHIVTMTSITEGPCGKFRFEDVPRLKIGLVHLDRKRPWPVAINPETGREWRVDMKQRMLDILDRSGHSVVRSDMRVTVSDDPSLREAIGEEIHGYMPWYYHHVTRHLPGRGL